MKRSACIVVVLVTVLLSWREDSQPTAPEPSDPVDNESNTIGTATSQRRNST
jgi:hypothetical protein